MTDEHAGDPIERAAATAARDPAGLPDAVVDDVALGLLVLATDETGLDVRRILPATAACESDVVGRTQELRAAGLIQREERGRYVATGDGCALLEDSGDT